MLIVFKQYAPLSSKVSKERLSAVKTASLAMSRCNLKHVSCQLTSQTLTYFARLWPCDEFALEQV